ncbi:MAG TPA: pyruvate kinase, partial [Planctomycetes bacterium]|nr:pyruvate kinase [Planctomycetota bacterium]
MHSAEHLQELGSRLTRLRDEALALVEQHRARVESVHPTFRESARNLLHYLALRAHDVRALQSELKQLGLSSLGRSEANLVAGLEAVSAILAQLQGQPPPSASEQVGFARGVELLLKHTEELLGPPPAGRETRIMVTLPGAAADDYGLVRDLVAAGMDLARINCAHETPAAWRRMVEHVRRAAGELERSCRIEMDLGGPKLRTGALRPGPQVVRVRPRRDVRGCVVAPARVWLAPEGALPEGDQADAVLPVAAEWIARAQPGDQIRFKDTRAKKRKLKVVELQGPGLWAEVRRTAYVEAGTKLTLRTAKGGEHATRVGALPPAPQPIVLEVGDELVLHAAQTPGRPARYDRDGRLREPAHVACTLPEALARIREGELVHFDDDRIEGVVREASAEQLRLEITRARPRGSRLWGDKGINFPDSELSVPGLTSLDREHLEVVAELADAVAISFVREPEDVDALREELDRLGAERLGIVLKIETRRGFEQLPWLLLAAMRNHAAGIMIARGDLAVEAGWERLAELQEELLWFAEAAHVPVIWATQVLEGLAKRGLPTRAEITDAAMAVRAECVMLNKG